MLRFGGRHEAEPFRFGRWPAFPLPMAAALLFSACGSEGASAPRTIDADAPYADHADLRPTQVAGQILSAASVLGLPGTLRVSGRRLWVLDASGDPYVHVLDIPTGDVLHGFGRTGEGPGEFLNVRDLSVVRPDSEGVWVFDPRNSRFTRLEPRALQPSELRTLQLKDLSTVTRTIWLDQDRIIGISAPDSLRFSIFDGDGSLVSVVKRELLGPDAAPYQERMAAWLNVHPCASVDGRQFALAFRTSGRVELYDRDARLTGLADVPYPSEPTFEMNEDRSGLAFRSRRRWYLDCASTGRHLYLLFSGRTSAAFSGDDLSMGEFVHVFDWGGSIRATYRLDSAASGIAVDPEEEELYTAAFNRSEIRRYDLPNPAPPQR